MKNFLFDLDGTLGNTLPLCLAAFREALEPLAGRRVDDAEIIAAFGPSEEGAIAALLPEKAAEAFEAYLQRYEALHASWPDPFEGMLDVLDYLKSKRAFIGIITGKGTQSTALTLSRYGLHGFFDVVKTGSSSGAVKDVRIDEVIDEFSLEREETLYVGDAPGDIAASRTSGIAAAAAAWAPTADREALQSMGPDYLFTSVSEFSEFIKRAYGD